MGHERWFRGQHDGQGRPFDWLTPARQHGIPWQRAQALYEQAVQQAQAHGASQGRVQELYLALLVGARPGAARPSPGKVTRTMRLQAHRAGKRRTQHLSHLTGQPIAPGKRPLTWYLEPARDERPAPAHERAADAKGSHGEQGAWPHRELPFRAEMERLFGEPLDGVRVEQDGALPRGALAATERERIVFADAAPSKATVAHEVAHVLQYRRGTPRTAARLGERGDPAEREARHAAAAALAGRSVQIRGTPTAALHLQERAEEGEEDATFGVTVIAHGIEFSRRGDGLEVEVM
jgi:hypothetical protein